jgi:hypothetical protein
VSAILLNVALHGKRYSLWRALSRHGVEFESTIRAFAFDEGPTSLSLCPRPRFSLRGSLHAI